MKKISFLLVALLMFVACEEIFFEEDFTEERTELIAPTNEAELFTKSVEFSWKPIEGATTYQLQIAAPDFLNLDNIAVDTEVEDVTHTEALELGNYEWRVRPKNESSVGLYGKSSFSIIDNPDFTARTIELTTVEDELLTNEADQTISWIAVTDAVLYRIQTLDASNNVLASTTTTETELVVTFAEGFQYWQVQAENAEEQVTEFAQRSITVDTLIPNDPVLVSPEDEEALTDTTVALEWTRVSVEGTDEFDNLYIYTSEDLDEETAQVFEEVTSPTEVTFEPGTYYWLIKSVDAAGNVNETSEPFSVIIN